VWVRRSWLPPGAQAAVYQAFRGFEVFSVVLEHDERAKGGKVIVESQVVFGFAEKRQQIVDCAAQGEDVDRSGRNDELIAFSFRGCCLWRGKSRA
jgi:hypothetical protein